MNAPIDVPPRIVAGCRVRLLRGHLYDGDLRELLALNAGRR